MQSDEVCGQAYHAVYALVWDSRALNGDYS